MPAWSSSDRRILDAQLIQIRCVFRGVGVALPHLSAYDTGIMSAVHHVYMVRCADGSLYTGYARDPARRVATHNSGRGARYTSGRRPVRLVYSESFDAVGDALRRENELKRWPRRKKELLIATRGLQPSYRISSLGGTSGTTVVPRKTANTNARRNVASTK